MLLSMMVTPAFPCGPMGGPGGGMTNNSGGGTTNMSPGRDKWTRKRMQELKRQRQENRHHGGPGAATNLISKMQQMNNPLAQTAADRHRDAVRKAQLINAIEFLALKKERGELSAKGQATLNALIQQYRTNYASGY